MFSLFPSLVDIYAELLLIVHNNPESFTEQIAGIVMVFALIKLNEGFDS